MKKLNRRSTPALLRQLAIDIEKDNAPSFLLNIVEGEDYKTAVNIGDSVIPLIGLVSINLFALNEKVER